MDQNIRNRCTRTWTTEKERKGSQDWAFSHLYLSLHLHFLRAGLPFPTKAYYLFTDDSQAYTPRYNFWANNTDNFYISVWMLYCHIRRTVLKLHFQLAPKSVVFPVSASGCTNSTADPSCSFTLFNPYHVLLQISLTFSLLPAVSFLIQITTNSNDFLTSFHSPA